MVTFGEASGKASKESVIALWRRAPMLVLLSGWLLLGVVPIPFDASLWGIGFLVLVAIQFVIAIRNWPPRR